MKSTIAILTLILVSFPAVNGQEIRNPNFLLTTHETFEVTAVATSISETIVRVKLTSYVEGGSFCIDKGMRIFLPTGNSLKLKSVTGVPECPDEYRFGMIGDQVIIVLSFEPIPDNTPWINLVEGCDDNCVTVYGLVLETGLNFEIDRGYNLLDNGLEEEAILQFGSVISSLKGKGHMAEAAIYSTLIELMSKTGKPELFKFYLNELLSSKSPGASLAISNLKTRGIIK